MNKPNTQVASCETTHTPGPWSISGVPGDNYVMAADGRNRVSVCQLMGWPGITPEELHANKHLIRSAPELLAACKAMVAHADKRQKIATIGTEDEELSRLPEPEFVEITRRAIAKAQGKPL